jgi:hypothetical protein
MFLEEMLFFVPSHSVLYSPPPPQCVTAACPISVISAAGAGEWSQAQLFPVPGKISRPARLECILLLVPA